MRRRIAIIDPINPAERSFMAPVMAHLRRCRDIEFVHPADPEAIRAAVTKADIVWLEWCTQHAVLAADMIDFGDRKVIVRLHSFEALDTPFPRQMFWGNVDHLVLVSDDIRTLLIEQNPHIAQQTDIRVIPNGIDCTRFMNDTTPSRTDIAWIGRLEMKKNPMLFLQIMARLVQLDPAYKLHIAGDFNDVRVYRYLRHLIGRMGLEKHIVFHGFVADMPEWLRDKGVLLSTTLYESFGMNIGEAMAAGAHPVIHHFPGADKIWPEECLFTTVEMAVEQIRAAVPNRYREFVRTRYDIGRQLRAIDALLDTENSKHRDILHFDAAGKTIKLHLPDRSDHIQRSIALTNNFYECGMLHDMRERAKLLQGTASTIPVAIDVGANIGNHTIFLATQTDMPVIALEPAAGSFAVLDRNIALNELQDKVTAINKGAGAQPARAQLQIRDPHNWGMNRLDLDDAGDIPVITLDSIVGERPVALMKIDVEGMELDVLRGATQILTRDRPLLYIEASDDAQRQLIDSFLVAFGYHRQARFNDTPTYLYLNQQTHAHQLSDMSDSATARQGQGAETARSRRRHRRQRNKTGPLSARS